jgi:hypothetical protein
MATVLFAAAVGGMTAGAGGGAIAVKVALAAGAIGGGIIDSYYVMPSLFPKPDTAPGRLTEFDLGSQTEGASINYCLGPGYRVPGTIIWVSDIREYAIRSSGGGKGGGGGSTITEYRYECDVLVSACEGPISKFLKIWTDGKLLYEDIDTFDETSSQFSSVRLKIREPTVVGNLGLIDWDFYYQEVTSPNGAADLTSLKSGEDVIISGFTNAGNNGTFTVSSTRTNPDGSTTVRILNPAAQTESAGASVTIYQARDKWDAARMEDIDFYLGTATQNADPLYQSHMGTANAPAYRGLAYVAIKGLRLGRYGNRVPQFAFLVEADESLEVGAGIGKVMERHGITAGEYDVSKVTGNLRGYGVTGPYSGVQILDPVMIANDLWAQESAGKLHFFPRGAYSAIDIDSDDVAAHAISDTPPPKGTLRDIDEYRMPTQVYVNYIDPASDYQRGSQNDTRLSKIHDNDHRVDVPVVLTSGEAKAVASRVLWTTWSGQRRIMLSVPPKYMELRESDLVSVTLWGDTYQALLTDVTRGASGMLELEGVVTEVQGYNEVTAPPLDYAQTFDSPSIIDLRLMDIPPIRKQDVDVPGYYYAGANEDAGDEWKGAAVYEGQTTTEMEQIATVTTAAVVGFTGTGADVEEQVVDDADAAASAVSGKWLERVHADAYGGKYRVAQEAGARFVWLFYNLTVGATYRAYVRFPVLPSNTDNVEFSMGEGFLGTGSPYYLSQLDRDAAHRWIPIGDKTLAVSNFGYIRVDTPSQLPTVTADAAKLVRIDNSRTLAAGPVGYWDRENTLTVTLEHGTLESKTEREVLEGANHALVGGEVIAFQNATLVSNGRYTLSTLLRGLRDTSRAIDSHIGTERFTLLDPQTLAFRPRDLADIGKPTYVKAVAPGEVEANIDPFKFQLVGATCRAMSPAQLSGERYATADGEIGLRFTWNARTRDLVRVLDPGEFGYPALDWNAYVVEIRDAENNLKRILGVQTPTYTYSNTLQQIDGFSASGTMRVWVKDFSRSTGSGNYAIITATSTL